MRDDLRICYSDREKLYPSCVVIHKDQEILDNFWSFHDRGPIKSMPNIELGFVTFVFWSFPAGFRSSASESDISNSTSQTL